MKRGRKHKTFLNDPDRYVLALAHMYREMGASRRGARKRLHFHSAPSFAISQENFFSQITLLLLFCCARLPSNKPFQRRLPVCGKWHGKQAIRKWHRRCAKRYTRENSKQQMI